MITWFSTLYHEVYPRPVDGVFFSLSILPSLNHLDIDQTKGLLGKWTKIFIHALTRRKINHEHTFEEMRDEYNFDYYTKEKEFNTSSVKNGNITYEVFFSQIKSHSVENLLHKISLTHIEL